MERGLKAPFSPYEGVTFRRIALGLSEAKLLAARDAAYLTHLVPTIAGGGVVIQGWDEHPGSDADRPDGAGAV